MALKISVVMPTRNRRESVLRALASLARQARVPDEVIIVDASDIPLDPEELQALVPRLRLSCMRSVPSVCLQRNTGIRAAVGTHILLCDDDLEFPPEYLHRLANYAGGSTSPGAITGTICDRENGREVARDFAIPTARGMVFRFLFQLGEWGNVNGVRPTWVTALPLALMKRWFRHRANTWSLAGWPLVTEVEGPVFRAATYGLGGALVPRPWLLASPFDERLGPHGIGDNYGVAIGFPDERPVTVLTDLRVVHHRAPGNRLDAANAHFERVLALDYFLRTSPRLSSASTACLAWSLVGRALHSALAGETALRRATLRALIVVATGRNPLLDRHVFARVPDGDAGAR